jgi:hypothetical protein
LVGPAAAAREVALPETFWYLLITLLLLGMRSVLSKDEYCLGKMKVLLARSLVFKVRVFTNLVELFKVLVFLLVGCNLSNFADFEV